MSRGLDHIVHAVADLDGAAQVYRQLGFTVGARNRHPWGTHNYIVQMPGFFIELLTLAEPDKMSGDGFSTMFAAYNRDFIARGDGLSMLVLESHDAASDETAFRAAGIAAAGAMRFDREGKRPDGSTVPVAFTLAFAKDTQAPDVSFFTCQQHYPENFWNPAFHQHGNGVRDVAGVVLVADRPAEHRGFQLAYSGAAAARDERDGFTIDLPRGAIGVFTPSAFADRFGQRPPVTERGPRLAALRFRTSDPAAAGARLEQAGHLFTPLKAGAISAAVLGATLVFEP
ncbi:MAG: VOC family protein [Pseudolabrys sp.]|nr:VOC family protein [Pseudolabrys sp.]MDP2296484.1 VOC family protein [Pseudolabrys sp.]